MNVVYLKSFLGDIKKIKDKKTNDKIKNFIQKLKDAESLDSLGNVKRLKGYSIAYRARLGDYRIGMFKENDHVRISSFFKAR